MPINLQDAYERAKLAADDSGLLSAYMYNQLVQALSEGDRHSFTLGLVDLGIQTKFASQAHTKHLKEVIYGKTEKDPARSINARLKDSFRKKSQAYQQNSSGLWLPDTYGSPSKEHEQDFSGWDQGYEEIQDEDIQEVYDIQDIISTLEENGIHVDKNGNVTFYKSNIPGIYTNQIPLKPISMDQALGMFQQNTQNVDKEQQRITNLQNILSGLNSDFDGLETSIEDMVGEFDSVLTSLDKVKYSENSPNKNVSALAEGLKTIKDYISGVSPDMDELRYGIGQHSDTISGLQKNLDSYYQTQYDMSGTKGSLADAMQELIGLKQTSPEAFSKAISGIGGVAARRFRGWRR